MKILLTVTMAMLVSASVFAADCKEGETCTKEECSKLGKDFSLNAANKCTKVGNTETETQCPGIVGTSGAKAVGSDADKTQASGTNVTK